MENVESVKFEDGKVQGFMSRSVGARYGDSFLAVVRVGEEEELRLYDPADVLSLASVASEMALGLEVDGTPSKAL
jgi:hypothetical protein